MLTGVLEGISAVPRWVAVAVGIGFLLGAAALAGRVAVDVAGPRAHRAAAATGVLVAALAGLSAVATESADAEGLDGPRCSSVTFGREGALMARGGDGEPLEERWGSREGQVPARSASTGSIRAARRAG